MLGQDIRIARKANETDMRAPQINELCEEVMSQSKTPRTDMLHQTHDEAAEWVEKSAGYMELLALARDLESELTRLSAEKAEWKERWSATVADASQARLERDKAESALLQAREDARPFPMQDGPPIPMTLARQIYAGYSAKHGTDQSLQRMGERGGFGWDEVAHLWKDKKVREAIDAARQAEPQEGEKR
jgi:hypothetical protein